MYPPHVLYQYFEQLRLADTRSGARQDRVCRNSSPSALDVADFLTDFVRHAPSPSMSLFGGLGGTQQTQQQASPFSFSSTPSLFGATQPQTQSPAPTQNLFPTTIPQPQPSVQQPLVFPTLPPPPTPPVFLVQKAVDPQRGPQPAAYSTRWDDLHPESQKILLSVE